MSHEIQAGDEIDGRFKIVDVINRSGMGSIYQATDMTTGEKVALKVPLLQFESDPAFFFRFEREAEIGYELDHHPHILRFIKVEGKKSRPYIVTEFLEGQTLAQVLAKVRPLPVADSVQICGRICDALEYMHKHGVIHRDLKPQNVMICNDGSLRVMDFGIAKAAEMRRVTFVGFSPPMGTPDYMAPELVKGRRGDEKTDIYELGAMLYEMTTGVLPFDAGAMTRRWGPKAARSVLLALQSAVDQIRDVSAEESIDTCFRPAGTLTVARGAHQLPALQSAFASYQRLGLADRYRFLCPEQVAEHIRITNVHGGLLTTDGASLHPGRLVRGLARAVEARGATLYEHTPVTAFRGGPSPALITPAGELRARLAIVLAGEAYLTRLRPFHRALLPAYSLISLTEPLSPAQWKHIGWQAGENLASTRSTVVYLTKTPSGRILFGSRGAPYAFNSAITDSQDRHADTHALIQRMLVEWFPSLQGIRFTHDWGGPVGMPVDWTPAVRFDPATRIAFAGGYTGQGVSTSNLAGQMLAGMISGRTTGFESLPFAQRRSPNWLPEPLRWLIVRAMQGGYLRMDEAAEAGRRPPLYAPLVEYLGRH